MKLSDFKNEQALDLIADIVDPASALLADEKFKNIIKGENKIKAIKYAIKEHKQEILEILAALDGVPVEQYNASVIQMIKGLLEVLNDKDLMSVFTSQSQIVDGVSFGSATESTEETETK